MAPSKRASGVNMPSQVLARALKSRKRVRAEVAVEPIWCGPAGVLRASPSDRLQRILYRSVVLQSPCFGAANSKPTGRPGLHRHGITSFAQEDAETARAQCARSLISSGPR